MKRSLVQSIALYTGVLCLAAFTLAPLAWLVLMSVSSPDDLLQVPLNWWPARIDFSRYAALTDLDQEQGQRFLAALRNSLIAAGGATAIALIIAVPAAYAFARRGASMARLFGFLATIMMPPITYVLPLYHVFGAFGLLNSLITLIVVYAAMLLPFAIWLM